MRNVLLWSCFGLGACGHNVSLGDPSSTSGGGGASTAGSTGLSGGTSTGLDSGTSTGLGGGTSTGAGGGTSTGSASAPLTFTVSPAGGALDWKQPITVTASAPISSDFVASGSLLNGTTAASVVAVNVLTLTPQPVWNDDSSVTLTLTLKDTSGNPSAPMTVTYDVAGRVVYVDGTAGLDSQAGTRAAPVQTIGHGLALAASQFTPSDVPEVKVAAGTYDEQVTVSAGVQLLGGYASGDWDSPASLSENPTLIQTSAAGVTVATVSLSDATRLQNFSVTSSAAATSQCVAVSVVVATTSPVVIADSQLSSGDCPLDNFNASIGLLITAGHVQLVNDTIANTNNSVTFGGSYGVLVTGADGILEASGGAITAANANNFSRGVDFSGDTLSLKNVVIAAGAVTDPLETDAVMVVAKSADIEGCTLSAGEGAGSTVGVDLKNVQNTATVLGNYIDGGQSDGSYESIGVFVDSPALIANNVITGGGSSSTSTCLGIWNEAAGVRILNNTVHAGRNLVSTALQLDQSADVQNNIFFFSQTAYITSSIALLNEASTGAPSTLRNNVFYDFDNDDVPPHNVHYAYEQYNATANTSCDGFSLQANCYDFSSATPLDVMVADAGGNSISDPGLNTLDAGGGQLNFFGANFTVANDWSLSSGSAVKAIGVDGSATFGFTTDINGKTRTGDGTSGWSPGAYETD